MGFNIFLVDDLIGACQKRFKRSKIEAETYRHVWEGLKLWISFQYDNGRGCELPQFGRIVLQPVAGDSGDKVYMPTFMLSARAVERHGLKQQKAALVATKRMHVAKLNHAAIAEACRMPREQVQETIKQLLWCLLEAMAFRSDVLVNFGVGDLKAAKRKVDCEFDREPGKGSTMPAMAPLTAQSERSLSRMSMRSSASTLRPPSAAGTELDWDSLSITGAAAEPSVEPIPEGDEGEGDAASEASSAAMGSEAGSGLGSELALPPISGAAPSDGGYSSRGGSSRASMPPSRGGSSDMTPAEKARYATEYLEKKKAQDWLAVHGAPKPEDVYLESVFDRYEDALIRSEAMLKSEQSDVAQAQRAEEQLREALAYKKKEERRKVAATLRTQMAVREKELQKQKLEDLIVGGPGAFPSSEAGLITAEVRKKEYLRDALDMQIAEKQEAGLLEKRYDMIQEQRRMQEDSRRYQEEIIKDMERRRGACKQLTRVWDRQRTLNQLTKQVSALY